MSVFGRGSMTAEARVLELERKVETIMRGLNLLLFEEAELFSETETEELRSRLDDYLKGRRSEFLPLDETQADVWNTCSQEGDERNRTIVRGGQATRSRCDPGSQSGSLPRWVRILELR